MFEGNHPGESAESRLPRKKYKKSILDFVMEDAQSLENKVSRADRRKLDEYLTGIREIETRIEHFSHSKEVAKPDIKIPEEKPDDFAQHFRLLGDLLVLAYQADLTRIGSFMVGNAGSNRSYKSIDVPEGHHSLSHHGKDEAKQKQISKINQFHASQMAYILDKMDQIKEGEGSMLDHSMILYGSGLSDGDRHNHDDLPIVLIGRGGGACRMGHHLVLPNETPLCNLYLTMLKVMNINAASFGDSRGIIEPLLHNPRFHWDYLHSSNPNGPARRALFQPILLHLVATHYNGIAVPPEDATAVEESANSLCKESNESWAEWIEVGAERAGFHLEER